MWKENSEAYFQFDNHFNDEVVYLLSFWGTLGILDIFYWLQMNKTPIFVAYYLYISYYMTVLNMVLNSVYQQFSTGTFYRKKIMF